MVTKASTPSTASGLTWSFNDVCPSFAMPNTGEELEFALWMPASAQVSGTDETYNFNIRDGTNNRVQLSRIFHSGLAQWFSTWLNPAGGGSLNVFTSDTTFIAIDDVYIIRVKNAQLVECHSSLYDTVANDFSTRTDSIRTILTNTSTGAATWFTRGQAPGFAALWACAGTGAASKKLTIKRARVRARPLV